MNTMETAYRIPATRAPQRALSAQPSQLKTTATPTHTACGVTRAAAIPAPIAPVPSEEAIPPVK